MSLITREMAVTNGHSPGHSNSNNNSFQTPDAFLPNGHHDPSNGESNQITSRNGPFAEDDMSRDYNAPPSSFSMPKQNGAVDRANNPLADFFSSEVFQIVLHNPATAHRLLKFSQARMCGENMEFLEKVLDIYVYPSPLPG